MPRKRFKLHMDAAARTKELSRELPETVQHAKSLWQTLTDRDIEMDKYLASEPNLTPWGLWESWLVRRQWQLHEASNTDALNLEKVKVLEPILNHPSTFFSYLQSPQGLGRSRLEGLYLTQTQCPQSIENPFDTVLDQHLESLGIEFKRGKKLETLEVARRQISRLSLQGDQYTYSADYFLANTAVDLNATLPEPHASKGYLKKPDAVSMTGGVLTLNVVVRTEAVPEGLNQQLLMADDADLLYLACFPAWRAKVPLKERHDPSHTVISISCRVSDEELHNSDNNPKALTQTLINRLSAIAPFVEEHIVAASFSPAVDHLSESDKRDTRTLIIRPGYEAKKNVPLGIVGRNMRTRFKNMLHVGRDVLPGLGVEGEYLTGQAAAARLQKLAKRKWQKQLKSSA